jgi:hypothetical protein
VRLSANNNPFFAQQVDTSRFPSFRVTLLGGAALALLLLVLEIVLYILAFRFGVRVLLFRFVRSLELIQAIPVFLMPVMSSLIAARIWRERADGAQGSSLAARQAITGLILSVFHRLRVLVVLMLLTIPILVCGSGIGRAILFGTYFRRPGQPTRQAIVEAALAQGGDVVFLLQLMGLFVMGGVIGSVLAIKINRPKVAAALAFLLTITLWPVYQVVVHSIPRWVNGWVPDGGLNALLSGVFGLLWLIPLGAAWAASRLARRWVQPST